MPTVQHAYLLRLWSEARKEGVVWHSQVDHLATGRRVAFDTLDDLLDFLRGETEETARDEPAERR